MARKNVADLSLNIEKTDVMAEAIIALLQKPFIQASLFLLLAILSILLIGPKNADKTWLTAGMIFIGFMLTNSLYIAFASDTWRYFSIR